MHVWIKQLQVSFKWNFVECRFAVQALCTHSIAIWKGDFHLWGKDIVKSHWSIMTADRRPKPRTLGEVFDDNPSVAVTVTIKLFFRIIALKGAEELWLEQDWLWRHWSFPLNVFWRSSVLVCVVLGRFVTRRRYMNWLVITICYDREDLEGLGK